jgi:hypothetical protein
LGFQDAVLVCHCLGWVAENPMVVWVDGSDFFEKNELMVIAWAWVNGSVCCDMEKSLKSAFRATLELTQALPVQTSSPKPTKPPNKSIQQEIGW